MKKVLVAVVGVLVVQLGLWACAGQASEVPVENGVQQVWVCGEKKGHTPLVDKMLDVAPGEQIGTWGVESEGDCHVWTHYAARLCAADRVPCADSRETEEETEHEDATEVGMPGLSGPKR